MKSSGVESDKPGVTAAPHRVRRLSHPHRAAQRAEIGARLPRRRRGGSAEFRSLMQRQDARLDVMREDVQAGVIAVGCLVVRLSRDGDLPVNPAELPGQRPETGVFVKVPVIGRLDQKT
jgi:hypothetical protein